MVRVCIYMPVHNGQDYLDEAIQSLRDQTFSDFVLFIIDDGSHDQTENICRKYVEQDSRIIYHRFQENQGEVAARNYAVTYLLETYNQAEYFMNHDSDDISAATKLSRLVALLDRDPTTSIVGCLAHYFGSNKQIPKKPHLETDREQIRKTFGKFNSVVHSAALIRRKVFEHVGLYREEFRSVDDYDFFARALMSGFNIQNIPEDLHAIRLHTQSVSAQHAEKQNRLAQLIRECYIVR